MEPLLSPEVVGPCDEALLAEVGLVNGGALHPVGIAFDPADSACTRSVGIAAYVDLNYRTYWVTLNTSREPWSISGTWGLPRSAVQESVLTYAADQLLQAGVPPDTVSDLVAFASSHVCEGHLVYLCPEEETVLAAADAHLLAVMASTTTVVGGTTTTTGDMSPPTSRPAPTPYTPPFEPCSLVTVTEVSEALGLALRTSWDMVKTEAGGAGTLVLNYCFYGGGPGGMFHLSFTDQAARDINARNYGTSGSRGSAREDYEYTRDNYIEPASEVDDLGDAAYWHVNLGYPTGYEGEVLAGELLLRWSAYPAQLDDVLSLLTLVVSRLP